ncbi:MAG: hypothetical protein A2138_20615 [Deltaproteobacteria bacterium RBG_16_71_12]|nr:MAG: hypothetical protein A2138_20615 [Deltaproteobacteria bacterium RBG_16_71_12]
MSADGGGWARLLRYAEGDACPTGWTAAPRGCTRGGSSASTFVTPPYAFSEMRGVVRAFGFGVSDAFAAGILDIEGPYVDGLAVTRGVPRRHVFSFAHGITDAYATSGTGAAPNCPCDGGAAAPPFVGLDYRCEAPADGEVSGVRVWDNVDLLFDGADIGDPLCVAAAETAPDFTVVLPEVSADVVELRIVANGGATNENIDVVAVDLWVR